MSFVTLCVGRQLQWAWFFVLHGRCLLFRQIIEYLGKLGGLLLLVNQKASTGIAQTSAGKSLIMSELCWCQLKFSKACGRFKIWGFYTLRIKVHLYIYVYLYICLSLLVCGIMMLGSYSWIWYIRCLVQLRRDVESAVLVRGHGVVGRVPILVDGRMRLVWQLTEGVMACPVAEMSVRRLRRFAHVRKSAQEVRIGVAHAVGQRRVRHRGAEGDGCVGVVHAGRLEGGHLRGRAHWTGHGRGGGIAVVVVVAVAVAVGELLAVTARRQGHRAAVGRVVELLLRCAALQR